MRHPAAHSRTVDHESVGVVAWRRKRLERAGCDAALANELSADWRIDLHAFLELVERGCPPQLAARILAPLDVEETEPT
jgi:hypothetical protein